MRSTLTRNSQVTLFEFGRFGDEALFTALESAMHRTFAALRNWPNDGARFCVQFADLVVEGRREMSLRELRLTRARLRIDFELLKRARRVANAAPVADLDLLLTIDAAYRRTERAEVVNEEEQGQLYAAARQEARTRQFAIN